MAKKKKYKKRKILLDELNWIIERNEQFCIRNDIKPSMYMEGVNDTAKKIKKVFKKIYKQMNEDLESVYERVKNNKIGWREEIKIGNKFNHWYFIK